MTYTSSYQPQVPGSSVYSPFNRNGAGAIPGIYPGAPSPAQPEMATDAFVPVASPEDMDRVVSSIDEKIARIRQAFSQPAPVAGMQPGQPVAAPVSQEEIQWALQLEQKVKGGQEPTPQETARYEDIAKRLAAAQQPQAPAAPSAPTAPAAAPVNQEEIQWALQLEQKVKGGQEPTPQETARYEDIAKRLAAAQQPQAPAAPSAPTAPVAAPVSQEEIQWALQLEQKVKGGQEPTPQETARYEDIAKRLAGAQQPQQPASPGAMPPSGARDWSNWSKPFAPPGASPMPLPIAAPGSGQPVVTVPTSLRGSSPIPPAVAMTQYVPAALPSAPAAPQPQMVPQQPQAPMAPQAAAPQMGNVSQEEIQWALQLEQRVKEQRYQPTPQEVATYENIAQRLNAAQTPAQQPTQPMAPAQMPPRPQVSQPQMASQQPQAPMAPQVAAPQMGNVSQEEIQWALQLEQRVKEQRYQPTPQEVATYENIAQRLNTAQTPAQQPTQPMAPAQMPPRPGMPPQSQQVMMPPTPQQVPIVPQQYPYVQGQTPQYIVQPQPFVPQQPQMAPQQMPPGMPQQVPGMSPPGQKPSFTDRLKTAWNALWG